MTPFAPEISLHTAESGLDCHCIINPLEPPDITAVIRALAPSQTVFDGVEIETVASALTITVATFEIGSKQSGLGSVMMAR